jgi:antitoxin VapB
MLMIDDPELERLIHEEAVRTGRPPVEVVRRALADAGVTARTPAGTVSPEEQARRERVIREIQEEVAKLPVLDPRPMDELLGYDENGLPT